MTSRLSAHLIIGDDAFLVSQEIDGLLEGVGELSVSEFEAAVDPTLILQSLLTPPMFDDCRIVLIKGAEDLPAESQRQLTSYLDDPAPDASLIMVSSKPLAKIAAAVKKVGRVTEVTKGKRTDVFTWLNGAAKERGLKFEGEGSGALMEAVGEDRVALSGALDELAIAGGKGARIGPDEVSRQFRAKSDVRLFGFIDAVANRQKGAALNFLHQLLAQGEAAPMLFWNLARHFRMLLMSGGRRPQEAAQILGIQAWRAEKLVRQARGFRPDDLVAAYKVLAEADRKMKTSAEPDELALERAVVAIAER